MQKQTRKPTHKLTKEFRFSNEESYPAGTSVFIPKLHRKHYGFCCNAFFLGKNGEIIENSDGGLAVFDKSHFKPLKDWFKPI